MSNVISHGLVSVGDPGLDVTFVLHDDGAFRVSCPLHGFPALCEHADAARVFVLGDLSYG